MSYAGTLILYLLIIFSTTIITKYAYKAKNVKQKKILIFLAIFILAIFAGLRFRTGSDWYQYYSGVEYVGHQGNTGWGEGKEGNYGLIYILICKLIYWIGGNGSVLLFVMAFLTYLFLFLTLERYEEYIDVYLGVFFYNVLYYLVTYNIVRQGLAITIGMYAISYLNIDFEKKQQFSQKNKFFGSDIFKYLFFSLLSILVHNSGYICLIAAPLCFLMSKKRIRWGTLLTVLICVLNYKSFMKLAIWITGIDVFRWYFSDWGEQGSFITYIIKYVPHILMCGLAYKSIKKERKIYNLYNLFLVGLIINVLSVTSNTEIERIAFVFLYMWIIVVPYALRHMVEDKCLFSIKLRINSGCYTFYKYFMFAFVLFLFYYYFFMTGSYRVVPYSFI